MKRKEEFAGYDQHEYNPIIRPQSEALLVQLVTKKQPKRILEIGTFIGYSASVMLEKSGDSFVVSIEKDKQNAEFAALNLHNLGFDGRFEIVCCDAMDFLKGYHGEKFDFIFLDGAKGQYIKYLPYLKKNLSEGGLLVCDDVLFYGLVQADGKILHKHRSIVNHLRAFLEQLQADADFKTTLYDFEDGVSVSELKRNENK